MEIRTEGRRHYLVGARYEDRQRLRDAGCRWVTRPDTTILLLRALARGATGAELERATGLTLRSIQTRIHRLEAAGVAVERPRREPGSRLEPGEYRLADRDLARVLR